MQKIVPPFHEFLDTPLGCVMLLYSILSKSRGAFIPFSWALYLLLVLVFLASPPFLYAHRSFISCANCFSRILKLYPLTSREASSCKVMNFSKAERASTSVPCQLRAPTNACEYLISIDTCPTGYYLYNCVNMLFFISRKQWRQWYNRFSIRH